MTGTPLGSNPGGGSQGQNTPDLPAPNLGITPAKKDEKTASLSDSVNAILGKREQTRGELAKSLVDVFRSSIIGAFLFILGSSFIPKPLLCFPASSQNPVIGTISNPTNTPTPTNTPNLTPAFCTFDTSSKDLITLILNSLTVLIGTALGFYFGSQGAQEKINESNK